MTSTPSGSSSAHAHQASDHQASAGGVPQHVPVSAIPPHPPTQTQAPSLGQSIHSIRQPPPIPPVAVPQFESANPIALPDSTGPSQVFVSGDFPPTGPGLDPGWSGSLDLDLNDLIRSIGLGYSQAIVFVIAGLTKSFDGIEVGLISFLIPLLRCVFDLSNFLSSALASAVYFGMCFGGLLWTWVADRYGRKPALLGTILCTCFFGLVSAAAPEPITLLLLRAGLGFGVGGTIPLAFGTFLEYCPVNRRGFWGVVAMVMWQWGACLAALLAWLTLGTGPTDATSWRIILVAGTVPGLVLIPILIFIHETPRYLVLSGKHHHLLYVLTTLARQNGRLEAFHQSLVSQAVTLPDTQGADEEMDVEEGGGTPGTCVQTHSSPAASEGGGSESDHSHGATARLILGDTVLSASQTGPSGQTTPPPVSSPSSHAVSFGHNLPRLWAADATSIDLDDVLERLVSLRAGAYGCAARGASETQSSSSVLSASTHSGTLFFPSGPRTRVSRGLGGLVRGYLRRVGGALVPRRAQRFFCGLDPFLIFPTTGDAGIYSGGLETIQATSSADMNASELDTAQTYRIPMRLFRQATRGATRRGSLRTLFSPPLRGLILRLIVFGIFTSFAGYTYTLSLPVLLGNTPNTCPVQFPSDTYIGLLITSSVGALFLVATSFLTEVPRLGRKWSGVILALLSGVFYGLLCLFTIFRVRLPDFYPGYTVLVAVSSVVNGLTFSLATLIWVYLTEAFPTVVRGVGTGVFSFFYRAASVLSPLFLGFFLDLNLLGELIGALAVSFLIIACVIWSLPFETSQMQLKDVSEEVKVD